MNISDYDNTIILKNNDNFIGSMKYDISNNLCNITALFIVNKYRRQNYSKYFFEYLFEKLKKLKVTKIILDAKEYYTHFNKLVNYYNKFGFEIDNDIKIKQKWVDGELVRIIRMYCNII